MGMVEWMPLSTVTKDHGRFLLSYYPASLTPIFGAVFWVAEDGYIWADEGISGVRPSLMAEYLRLRGEGLFLPMPALARGGASLVGDLSDDPVFMEMDRGRQGLKHRAEAHGTYGLPGSTEISHSLEIVDRMRLAAKAVSPTQMSLL